MTITQAKLALNSRCPFFGTIVFHLPVVEDDKTVPTAGVDGEVLYVNTNFWNTLTPKQQVGILAHEVGHLFLDHIARRKNRVDVVVNPDNRQMFSLWNIACDYAVNPLVLNMLKSGMATEYLPKNALIDKKYENMATESIYESLRKDIPKMKQPDMKKLFSGHSDKSKWGKASKETIAKASQKIKGIVKQAFERAKAQGNLPAGLERLFENIEPKEDWRAVLMSYVQPFVNDYSLSRPDRRFLEDDFYLPDIKDGEQLDWIAIAIDTSGSIDNEEVNKFIGEIKGIILSYDKVRVKVTFCDSKASDFVELEDFEPKRLKVTGGGGTDFTPVFNIIKKESNQPKALLYFTDLAGTFPDKNGDYDTIWITKHVNLEEDTKVPFGKILPY